MTNKVFPDHNLRYIDPAKLLKNGKNDKVDDFFLVLGVIYNDLKSIFFYVISLEDKFKAVATGKISSDNGEYGGQKGHLLRLLFGTVHEFFIFLKENEDAIETHEFIIIYNKLPAKLQKQWDILVGLSKERVIKNDDPFAKSLMIIRSNVSFHYNLKQIREGYRECFFSDEKNFANKKAYYSIGETMRETRFYYCDAAANRSMKSIAEKRMGYQECTESLMDATSMMNFTIMNLLKIYIKNR